MPDYDEKIGNFEATTDRDQILLRILQKSSASATSGAATEATLATLLTEIQKLTAQRTTVKIVTSGTHNIPVGATEVDVFNNGTADAQCNGGKLPSGVTESYGYRNPIDAPIAVDGGGTVELIITYQT